MIFSTQPGLAQSPGPCGDSYIVLSGDTIEGIAQLCGTTVEAILDINPEIYDPENLYVGQIIRIPYVEAVSVPYLAISPSCGIAGTSLTVVGSKFPPNETVQISLGPKGQNLVIVGNTASDEFGGIDTNVVIPQTATTFGQWVAVGETVISTAVFRSISNAFSLIRTPLDPDAAFAYQTQQGDTFESIATQFNRSTGEVRAANLQISARDEIPADTVVRIPAVPTSQPQTTISPYCGPADSLVQVVGSNFPAGGMVNLSTGIFPTTYTTIGSIRVNPVRNFSTSAPIPSTATPGEQWVVLANTAQEPVIHSTTNIYVVTQPLDPKEPQIYVVQAGDSLNEIAATYKRTVASIMEANPQISNPNQVTIGEKLIIPGQKETLLLSPVNGPPETELQVAGVGFTPNLIITVGFGQKDKAFTQAQTIMVDPQGNLRTVFSVPNSSLPGEIWTITAIQPLPSGSRILAVSNEFSVTKSQQAYQPYLSIWPISGIPGTRLYIVGANFPPKTQVSISVAPQSGSSEQSISTWSDINGSFAIYSSIPLIAEQGETWLVTAKTLTDPIVEATSSIFTVIGPGVVLVDQVDIYLIVPGTIPTECSIDVGAISKEIQPTPASLFAAINEILKFKEKNDSITGYYNALYLSNLEIGSVQINEQEATVHLTGQLNLKNSCDYSQIRAQLEATILQYPEITSAKILINGKPLEEYDLNQ